MDILSQNMKKIIILSSLALLLVSNALAVSFTTPIHLGDLVDYSVNCASEGVQDPPGTYTGGGNSWQLFNSDGSNYGISGGAVCLTNWNYSAIGIVPGDYTLVEFNPSSQVADINAVNLSTETSDPGFVVSSSLSVLSDPTPTGSDILRAWDLRNLIEPEMKIS